MAITVTHLSAAALRSAGHSGSASVWQVFTGRPCNRYNCRPCNNHARSGYVGPQAALIIGFVAGIICQEAVSLFRGKLKIDDALDVFAATALVDFRNDLCGNRRALVGPHNLARWPFRTITWF